jgi:DNA-directed RNA polymerase specialized sigma24 family protein
VIEKEPLETIYNKESEALEERIQQKLDVETLMNLLPDRRYRKIIRLLILEGQEPHKTANAMGITIDNLYNVKHRALTVLIRTVKII